MPELNKNSKMECATHGLQKPAFICQHLAKDQNVGFNQPDHDESEDGWDFNYAWCDDCDEVLIQEGEWNNVSEEHAKIVAICEGCFAQIKAARKV